MRRLGLALLKLVAFLLAEVACFLLVWGTSTFATHDYFSAADIVEPLVIGVVALAASIGLYALARAREPKRALYRTPQEPSLPWAPAPGEGWRPHSDWARLPDPLPRHPLPAAMPAPSMPNGPVPPDETLRRLWLVRAHLVSYRHRVDRKDYWTSGEMWRDVTVFVLTLLGTLSFGGFTLFGAKNGFDRVVGLSITLPFLVVAGKTLVVMVRREGLRRYYALLAEQKRLSALDAGRPGGPIGGPDIAVGARTYATSGPATYTPPTLPDAPIAAGGAEST